MHKVKIIIVELDHLEELEDDINYFLRGKSLTHPVSITVFNRYEHPPEAMATIDYLEDGTEDILDKAKLQVEKCRELSSSLECERQLGVEFNSIYAELHILKEMLEEL